MLYRNQFTVSILNVAISELFKFVLKHNSVFAKINKLRNFSPQANKIDKTVDAIALGIIQNARWVLN